LTELVKLSVRVRFQVLVVAGVKVAASCSVVEVCRCFRGTFCFHLQDLLIALVMGALNTSETSVNFYQATWHNNPEDGCLQQKGMYSLINLLM
jgi:hypothetical protein